MLVVGLLSKLEVFYHGIDVAQWLNIYEVIWCICTPFFVLLLGFAESLHHAKQKAQTKLYCQTIVLDGHKIILRHLICQIRNALHFLDFASWCKDSAIPVASICGS